MTRPTEPTEIEELTVGDALRRAAAESPDGVALVTKAFLFGLAASLIACHQGLFVGGGPEGVGNAVNETVVYSFLALFMINVVATAVGVEITR